VVACVALVVFGVAWPWEYLACPRWEVWVVNEQGQPLPGAVVHLTYMNYSAESSPHRVTRTSDHAGYAVFPPQYGRASCLRQASYSWANFRKYTLHASYGRHAHVFAIAGDSAGSALTGIYITDWTGRPATMQSRIIATPRPH
jgi:hypothetical protein